MRYLAGGSVFACGRVLLLMHTIPVTSANSLLGRASHVVKCGGREDSWSLCDKNCQQAVPSGTPVT